MKAKWKRFGNQVTRTNETEKRIKERKKKKINKKKYVSVTFCRYDRNYVTCSKVRAAVVGFFFVVRCRHSKIFGKLSHCERYKS